MTSRRPGRFEAVVRARARACFEVAFVDLVALVATFLADFFTVFLALVLVGMHLAYPTRAGSMRAEFKNGGPSLTDRNRLEFRLGVLDLLLVLRLRFAGTDRLELGGDRGSVQQRNRREQ